MVNDYIAKSGNVKKIKPLIGDALELIPGLKREFDIVFIDADKSNYINYYNLTFDKVRPGGYFMFDNVLWSGKVLNDLNSADKDTKVLVELNKLIHEDDRVQEALFPIRDGLLIARKK